MSHELAEEKLKTRDYAYNMEEKKMLQQSIEQALHDQGKNTMIAFFNIKVICSEKQHAHTTKLTDNRLLSTIKIIQ